MARRRRRMLGSERRGAPRVRVAVPMRVTAGDTTVEGVGYDLSSTGLCLDAPLKARAGASVVIAFRLEEVDLQLEGRIRWRRDDFVPRLGIELDALTDSQAIHLSEFVAHRNVPRTGDTLELPVIPPDSTVHSQPPVGPELDPAPSRNRRAAVAIPEQVRAATAGPPKNKRPGGRTRHYSLRLDDSDS